MELARPVHERFLIFIDCWRLYTASLFHDTLLQISIPLSLDLHVPSPSSGVVRCLRVNDDAKGWYWESLQLEHGRTFVSHHDLHVRETVTLMPKIRGVVKSTCPGVYS